MIDSQSKEVEQMAQASAPMGPFCQSCSMPLSKPEDFGTTAEGFRQNDYCHLCYQDGSFFQPDMTLDQMMEFVVQHTIQATGMSEEAVQTLLHETLPRLKRWWTA